MHASSFVQYMMVLYILSLSWLCVQSNDHYTPFGQTHQGGVFRPQSGATPRRVPLSALVQTTFCRFLCIVGHSRIIVAGDLVLVTDRSCPGERGKQKYHMVCIHTYRHTYMHTCKQAYCRRKFGFAHESMLMVLNFCEIS